MDRTEEDIMKNWPVNVPPLVSITCIAYNHEKFIAVAIEGFLIQETNFPFEIIIHDDASTDKTQSIIKKYSDNYPNLIRTILQKENHWLGKGINATTTIVWPSCKGKYIAWCEGDDFWTDPNKLQKQVDFLEVNEDYAICFHRVYELEDEKEPLVSKLNTSEREETYTIENLAAGNFIHTPSVVFRNGLIKRFPEWFVKAPVGDYPLYLIIAKHGKIKYFPEPMAVYRKHFGGLWSGKSLEYTHLRWIILLDLLIEEFKSEPNVKKVLEEQKAVIHQRLSEYYEGENLTDQSREHLYQSLKYSSTLFEKYDKKYQDTINRLINSWAYRVGKIVVDPVKKIKSIFMR